MLEHNNAVLCQDIPFSSHWRVSRAKPSSYGGSAKMISNRILPLNEMPQPSFRVRGNHLRPLTESELSEALPDRLDQTDIPLHKDRKTRPPAQGLQSDIPAAGKQIEE